MKKLRLLATAALITMVAACHRGRYTVIASDNNGSKMKIEYSGKILLTADGKSIQSISQDGYLEYRNNDRKIKVERESGQLIYKVNGGDRQTQLDTAGKVLLTEAVTELKKHDH